MKKVIYIFDKEVFNSILIGLVFMFVYTAFYTISNLEKLLLHSVQIENPAYTGDGFVSLSIFYLSFALSLWIVPPIINLTGLNLPLLFGAVGFSVFLASFLAELGWVLYLGSVCSGVGAALVWTTQGAYNVLNSTSHTITRNVAIFTGLCHSSLLYGNLFLCLSFAGKTSIDHNTRTLVVSVLLGVSVLGVLTAGLLPAPVHKVEYASPVHSTLRSVQDALSVTRNPNMLGLCPMFVYCGLQISYFSGILGAAVGFTNFTSFPSAQLVAVTGFFTGVGEILAEIFLVLSNRLVSNRPWMRSIIVVFALTVQLLGYFLSYVIFSDDSVFGPSSAKPVINSSAWLAVVIAVCLGFGDGVFMPMLISLIGKMYPNGSSSIFTLPTFFFSSSSAVSFFYSSYLGLYSQLVVLAVAGCIGALAYCLVNRNINLTKHT